MINSNSLILLKTRIHSEVPKLPYIVVPTVVCDDFKIVPKEKKFLDSKNEKFYLSLEHNLHNGIAL